MASILQGPRTVEFAFRPAEKADDAFLVELYAATHGQELRLLPLPDPQLSALIQMQLEAQRQSYARQYAESERLIVWRAARPIGHCWLCSSPQELRILDIALLPEHQGRGIGTAILHGLIERARESAKTLRLSVRRANINALRLYRNLGFEQLSEDSVSIEMQYPL